ncbi:MAG TPA: hypothetical protein VMV50_02180 [Candidatus Paceibacterota bacterium]|nr:hypothetical protein [Candidatus Paceibacterota bacterium]
MFYHHFYNKPPFSSQDFLTALAVLVALATPWIVNWLTNRQKRSRLVFEGTSVIGQDDNPDTEEDLVRLLSVGRLIIKNEGKYIAKSVEAYIDRIKYDGEWRDDFFPMPLLWTHGQLNKDGLTIRNIYPNQTVYLDLFNYLYDSSYVGDNSVVFAVAAGQGVDSLWRTNFGESELFLKFYQESGQVDEVSIRAVWDGKDVPKISIIGHRVLE